LVLILEGNSASKIGVNYDPKSYSTTIKTFDKKKERTISLEHDNLFNYNRI
jgi:hypothetical protein